MRESATFLPAASVGARLLRLALPAAIAVALVSAGLGYWWLQRGSESTASSAGSAQAVGAAADAPDPVDTLLVRARTALQERRLLTPAGDNAVESYLALLELDPEHRAARQALLELVPLAATEVQASIAGGELGEAQRQIELVERMGAGALILGTLRRSLGQARDDVAALAAQAAATERALADARPTPVQPPSARAEAPAPAAREAPAAERVSASAASRAPSPPPAVQPAPDAASTAMPEPAASIAAPAVQEARQIVDVRPAYPANARQRRTEGWVELEALVGSDGSVHDVAVVRSEPARIFDREAVRAAQRWRFEPRRENGVAVASRVRKTVTFRLAAG